MGFRQSMIASVFALAATGTAAFAQENSQDTYLQDIARDCDRGTLVAVGDLMQCSESYEQTLDLYESFREGNADIVPLIDGLNEYLPACVESREIYEAFWNDIEDNINKYTGLNAELLGWEIDAIRRYNDTQASCISAVSDALSSMGETRHLDVYEKLIQSRQQAVAAMRHPS